MIKNIILVIAIFASLQTNAQEKVGGFTQSDNVRRDVFSVVNNANKEVALFFIDKTSLKAHRFNKDLNIIDTLGQTFPKKEMKDIVGYSRSNNTYFIYGSGSEDSEMVCQTFDFDNKKATLSKINVSFDKEKTIDEITVNDIFYRITVDKGTSVLHFYQFKDGKVDKKTIDCSAMSFKDKNSVPVNFWDLYREKSGTVYHNAIKNILPETPASLVYSTNKKKAYVNGNTLTFTFNENEFATQTISFDLEHFTASQKNFQMPFLNKAQYESMETNSFLVNDLLLQMKLNAGVMKISFSDLQGNELKTLTQWAGKEIEFKNSEIIQEQANSKSTRILDNSSQLIRKIHNMNPSVSAYFIDNKYHLVIGGVSYPQASTGAMIMGGMLGGAVGAIIASSISSAYAYDNLIAYNDKKVVYIYSVFDKDLNHVKGDSGTLAFDKMRNFVTENPFYSGLSIFKLNNNLILGGFDKKNNEYSFFKFSEN